MLDNLFSLADVILKNPIPDWDPTGTKNYETGEEDNWVNSSFDLNFGSRTQWTLVGRHTEVNYGRKLEYKIDVDQFILSKFPSLNKLIADGGFTSFIYGSESNLSYGSSNWTFQRKEAAAQEFETIQDKMDTKTKRVHITFILLTLAIVVLYRVNALVGFLGSKNKESVEKWNSLLTNSSNEIQYWHIYFIKKWEKANYAKKAVEKAVSDLQKILTDISANTLVATQEVTNRVTAILNSLDAKQQSEKKITDEVAKINKSVKDTIGILNNVTTQVGAIIDVYQNSRANWYETNKKFQLHCDSYTVDAAGNDDNTPLPVSQEN